MPLLRIQLIPNPGEPAISPGYLTIPLDVFVKPDQAVPLIHAIKHLTTIPHAFPAALITIAACTAEPPPPPRAA